MLQGMVEFYNSGGLMTILTALGGIMVSARIITTMTPNKVDDKIVNSIIQTLNVLSGGVGKNKVS